LNSVIFEPLFFILKAAIIIVAIPLFLSLSNFIKSPRRKKLILEEDISPSKNFLSLFNITKKNFKYQLLYGILLLFLVYGELLRVSSICYYNTNFCRYI
jgi:hypothetical protein